MTDEQSGLYAASVARMRSQITGKAAAAAADRSNKAVEKFLRTLGAKKISHMFTHLRKIAQHPLLVRSNFTDDQVAVVARMAHERWVGGWKVCTARLRCSRRFMCVSRLVSPCSPTPPPRGPPPPTHTTHTHHRRSLFGGAATEKRVREELLSYSDFSLHAFCYNAGPEFAQFRLNQSHMMASAKFRFLERLLKQVQGAPQD
jgi:SWI/SNF-related matrix-associated actin-dependent regulator 1 of chromatin subfamily A